MNDNNHKYTDAEAFDLWGCRSLGGRKTIFLKEDGKQETGDRKQKRKSGKSTRKYED